MKTNKEQSKVEEPKGQKFYITPNRISRLWWKAQREVKARPDFAEMPYEEFTVRVNDQWKKLALEHDLDINDKSLFEEESMCVPVDKQGNEIGKPFPSSKMGEYPNE
tara:strand:- start:59 stop:379 length:321 start_codon:yes stop_codon:yes gene_type:complete